MEELLIMIVVFGALVLIVDHIRRLFSHAFLNRTIREALKHHPDSVPALLEKLEARHPLPIALGGWVFLGLGVLFGLLNAVYGDDLGREALTIMIGFATLGAAMLLWSWWNGRKSLEAANLADQNVQSTGGQRL